MDVEINFTKKNIKFYEEKESGSRATQGDAHEHHNQVGSKALELRI